MQSVRDNQPRTPSYVRHARPTTWVDTRWIKEQLGHDDISTTIDMYAHEDLETMIEKVGKRGPAF